MAVDGVLAQNERRRDLGVRVALRDETEHFPLARAELATPPGAKHVDTARLRRRPQSRKSFEGAVDLGARRIRAAEGAERAGERGPCAIRLEREPGAAEQLERVLERLARRVESARRRVRAALGVAGRPSSASVPAVLAIARSSRAAASASSARAITLAMVRAAFSAAQSRKRSGLRRPRPSKKIWFSS
jgi:hypothetical protein